MPAPGPVPGGPACRPRSAEVTAGLFELRKDAITGWWVATVVDRAFHRDRFARPADQVDDGGDCQNCRLPPGDGVRLRTLKDFAFHVVGTDEQSRERDASVAQVSLEDARASGSWRTIVAPPGEHRPLHAVGSDTIVALLGTARTALTVARGTNRIVPARVVVEDESHAVGAIGIVADVDIESQLERFAEVDARLRHHTAVLELRIRDDHV